MSTIYLALAIKANSHQHSSSPRGKVIATENESTKAARARAIWADVGEGISEFIDLREGDLLQTLKEELPVIDLLVLDSESPIIWEHRISLERARRSHLTKCSLGSNGFTHFTTGRAANAPGSARHSRQFDSFR